MSVVVRDPWKHLGTLLHINLHLVLFTVVLLGVRGCVIEGEVEENRMQLNRIERKIDNLPTRLPGLVVHGEELPDVQ